LSLREIIVDAGHYRSVKKIVEAIADRFVNFSDLKEIEGSPNSRSELLALMLELWLYSLCELWLGINRQKF